jgi:predicted metal-binding membrane protein
MTIYTIERNTMSGYTIIDVDTHVTETPELWTSRAPASMRDRVPHVVVGRDGNPRWLFAESTATILTWTVMMVSAAIPVTGVALDGAAVSALTCGEL